MQGSGAKVVLSRVLLLYTHPAIVSARVPLCRLNYRCRVVLFLLLELDPSSSAVHARARVDVLSLTLYTPFVHPYPLASSPPHFSLSPPISFIPDRVAWTRRHLNTKVSPWLTVCSFNVASGYLTAGTLQLLPLASTERQSDLYGRRLSTRRHFARWQLLPLSSYPYGRETHISSLSQSPPPPPLHYTGVTQLCILFSTLWKFYLLYLHIARV